jgi:hypothetical protein
LSESGDAAASGGAVCDDLLPPHEVTSAMIDRDAVKRANVDRFVLTKASACATPKRIAPHFGSCDAATVARTPPLFKEPHA